MSFCQRPVHKILAKHYSAENRGLTEENTQLGIISPISYFKFPICDIWSNWGLGIYFPIGDFRSPIGDKMPKLGYCLVVLE